MATPNCPVCGGGMWDEQTSKFWNNGIDKKTGAVKPIFKCKEKTCAGKIFAQGNGSGGAQSGAAGVTHNHTPTAPADPEATWKLYEAVAKKYCTNVIPALKLAGVSVTHEGASAGIAAAFIAANGGSKH